MNLSELKSAVEQLTTAELQAFAVWLDDFVADAWDSQIEADIKAERLDAVGRQAAWDFEAGRCHPL